MDIGAILDLLQGGNNQPGPVQQPSQRPAGAYQQAPQGLGEFIGRTNTTLPQIMSQFQTNPRQTYDQISQVVGPDKANEFLQYFNTIQGNY